MDQEETREIQEEETNVPKDGKKGMNLYTLIVLSVAAVLIFAWMMFGEVAGDVDAGDLSLVAVEEIHDVVLGILVHDGEGSVDKDPVGGGHCVQHPLKGFDNESFKGYSRQVFEVAYSDDAGKEGIRFSKAYTCNGFEVYEPEDGVFRSIQIMDVDGIDVKEYGDGEKVSLLFFVKGDYSYTILCPDNPMPREDAEVFVSQLD